MKGTFAPSKNIILPKHVLVVAQFSIPIILITANIVVYQQIHHIKNRKVGYDASNLVMIPITGDIQLHYASIKQELQNSGLIESVTRTSSPITEVWWKSEAPDWIGKPSNLSLVFSGLRTDADFSKTVGIEMLQGKDFSGMPADSASLLLNAAAVEAMGLKEPVGMELRLNGRTYRVIGVTDNIVMESPFKPVDPMMVFYSPHTTSYVNLRIRQGVSIQEAIQQFQLIFSKHNNKFPFEYSFVDAEFSRIFVTEELIGKIINIFATLAIFICCIGLAGLASFTIEKRFREIGIHKIMGASISQVLVLIAGDFMKLVLMAFVIAAPIAWWLMQKWLQQFVFRIDISWWIFAAVGALIFVLALLVVRLNTVKAAVSNPVKSLRTE